MKQSVLKLLIGFAFIFVSTTSAGVNQHQNVRNYNIPSENNKIWTDGKDSDVIYEADCSCKNGKCVKNSKGVEECICNAEYGLYKGNCKACECGTGSNCTFSPTIFSFGKKCVCKIGYIEKSSKCVVCPCKNGKCVRNSKGKEECKCRIEYGLYKDGECRACKCGKDSNCTFSQGWTSDGKICVCKPGYKEKSGTCDGPCTKNPCKNGGTCQDFNTSYKCNCTSNYTGPTCETKVVDPCQKNPCRNGGWCIRNGTKAQCKCPNGYTGDLCDKDPCTKNPCQNGGTCTMVGKKINCTCVQPYSGKMCEINPCTKNPCQNGGTCAIVGKNINCTCVQPYSGKTCEISEICFR